MALQLISKTEIRAILPLSVNIPDERINPFILEAQHFDLRKLMGRELYDKVAEEISPANYPELQVQYAPFLAYSAYARFLRHNQVTVTANGVVQKKTDFSDPIPIDELSKYISSALDGARVYESDFIYFMNLDTTDAATNYPEWLNSDNCDCSKGKAYSGVRITKVGKDVINTLRDDYTRARRR